MLESLFKKVAGPAFVKKLMHRFLIESAKIENETFPYTMSKFKVRITQWVVQNEPVTKNGVWPVTTLFFLKILFHYKDLL